MAEYWDVYPVGWNIDDVVELERMESNGEIVVLVNWIEGDRYIPNH